MLVVLDGWGWREEAADNAVRQANTPTFDRLWAHGPHAFLRTAGRDVGLPPRPDGQFRGRPSQHRRRPRGDAGPAAHRRRHRLGRDREGAGADRPDRQAEAERRHLPPDRPRLARRRAFAPGPRRGAGENPRRRRRADGGACHHRRPRHAAAIGRRGPEALHRRAAEVGAGRDRARPLLRDGPRQALGARRQGLRRHRRGRRPALSRSRRPRSPTPMPRSSSTSSSCRR